MRETDDRGRRIEDSESAEASFGIKTRNISRKGAKGRKENSYPNLALLAPWRE
jgi:hypothetical protein